MTIHQPENAWSYRRLFWTSISAKGDNLADDGELRLKITKPPNLKVLQSTYQNLQILAPKRLCEHEAWKKGTIGRACVSYIVDKDGLGCLVCIRFPVEDKQVTAVTVGVYTIYIQKRCVYTTNCLKWKDAKADLNKYAATQNHQMCMAKV